MSVACIDEKACPLLKIVTNKLQIAVDKMAEDKNIKEEICVNLEWNPALVRFEVDYRGQETGISYLLFPLKLLVDPEAKIFKEHFTCDSKCSFTYNFLKSLDDSEWV